MMLRLLQAFDCASLSAVIGCDRVEKGGFCPGKNGILMHKRLLMAFGKGTEQRAWLGV